MLWIKTSSSRFPLFVISSNANRSIIRAVSGKSINDPNPKEKINEERLVLFEYDSDTRVGIISLNNPKMYNALSISMGRQFQSIIRKLTEKLTFAETNYYASEYKRAVFDENNYLDSIMNNNDISKMSAIVLTGNGNKAFCTGADYHWLRSLDKNPVHTNSDVMYSFYKSFLCIRDLPIPTIAAIQGPAIGMGACLTLACDLRIILGERPERRGGAYIAFPFGKLGIHSGLGGSHFAPLVMGESQAMEAMLLGKVFEAEEALRVGLVNRVFSMDSDNDYDGEETESDFMKRRALGLGKIMAGKHPLALRSMMRSMRMKQEGIRGSLEVALRREAYAQALCFAKNDFCEGVNAVIEGRIPNFDEYHEP